MSMAYPRRRLPRSARAALPRRVQILSWCAAADGRTAVVTSAALVVLREGEDRQERAWGDVDHASLDADRSELTVTWVDGSPATVLPLPEEQGVTEFTRAVKERVDHSLVHHEIEKLPGGGHLRGAIRRNPDGSLFSQVTVSGTSRPPGDIEDRARSMEQRVRAAVGMQP